MTVLHGKGWFEENRQLLREFKSQLTDEEKGTYLTDAEKKIRKKKHERLETSVQSF